VAELEGLSGVGNLTYRRLGGSAPFVAKVSHFEPRAVKAAEFHIKPLVTARAASPLAASPTTLKPSYCPVIRCMRFITTRRTTGTRLTATRRSAVATAASTLRRWIARLKMP
jgi:hypothetical protein